MRRVDYPSSCWFLDCFVWARLRPAGAAQTLEEFVVLEAVTLHIRTGQSAEFEQTFRKAQTIIAGMQGYLSHELQRSIEKADEYLLLVRWRTLEDHTVGFRNHPEFAEWKRLLHHFYDPTPVIQHYEVVEGPSA
jgi:heme-degrading monooxygenase HmoA